jgi:hypothetical protein
MSGPEQPHPGATGRCMEAARKKYELALERVESPFAGNVRTFA